MKMKYCYVLRFENSKRFGWQRNLQNYGTQARKAGDCMTFIPIVIEKNQED
jgi:hypothetical protein